ncbi:hypothetical protein ACVPPR_06840 [Dellaglioa sp. L3N]
MSKHTKFWLEIRENNLMMMLLDLTAFNKDILNAVSASLIFRI